MHSCQKLEKMKRYIYSGVTKYKDGFIKTP